jgi:hypothetical protein
VAASAGRAGDESSNARNDHRGETRGCVGRRVFGTPNTLRVVSESRLVVSGGAPSFAR